MKIVPIVVIDVKVIGIEPVVRPVFRPRVYKQERIPAVLEARISHVHNWKCVEPEEMLVAEIETETGLRDVEATVASTLRPGSVVGSPVLGAILLPTGVPLPRALLCPALLLLP